MKIIVLISCVSKKGNKKTKDLYESSLFKKSLAYGQKLNPDKIYILLAFHHLLDLDTEMKRIQQDFRTLLQEEKESQGQLINAFKTLGYEL